MIGAPHMTETEKMMETEKMTEAAHRIGPGLGIDSWIQIVH